MTVDPREKKNDLRSNFSLNIEIIPTAVVPGFQAMQHIAKQETKLSWASGGKQAYVGPILFKKNGISWRKEVWSTTDPKSVGKLMADK